MCFSYGVSHFVLILPFISNHRCQLDIHSRENTVLRGQLFERSEEDPNVLEVRKSVYVIPSALIAEQFTPCPPPPSDKSLFSSYYKNKLLSHIIQ